MASAYLSLGSNIGNKKQNIIRAVALLAERVGDISALSSLYKTKPWGFASVHPFLNAAVVIDTCLSSMDLLRGTQQIERELGRTQKSDGTYHDRIIDIDILMYDEEIIETPTLIIPHPLMHRRTFVLEPLAEIAPEIMHPVFHKSIYTLYIGMQHD